MAKIVCLHEPRKDCDVKVLIAAAPDDEERGDGDGYDQLQSVVLYATSARLSEVPYFHTSLTSSWQPPGSGKVLLKSVSAAAKIMRCADHLLFKTCVDKCMMYLAAAPWSDEDERAIRNAVSAIGLPLSLDLVARLDDCLDERQIFKEFLNHLTQSFECTRVTAIVKDAAAKAPHEMVKSFYKPLFLQVWSEITQLFLQESKGLQSFKARFGIPLKDHWVSFTRTLLLCTDAKAEIAKAIALQSNAFQSIHSFQQKSFFTSSSDIACVLIHIFEGAISVKHGSTIFLSNSERASLLVTWAPVVNGIEDANVNIAFKNVFVTLPPRHPSGMRLVTENRQKPFFEPCFVWWRASYQKCYSTLIF
ncbi:hypothetical protein L7F22_015793 [Adiantum nelumboides]|nr:hypothetical protein [Adiantum nelumboides]